MRTLMTVVVRGQGKTRGAIGFALNFFAPLFSFKRNGHDPKQLTNKHENGVLIPNCNFMYYKQGRLLLVAKTPKEKLTSNAKNKQVLPRSTQKKFLFIWRFVLLCQKLK
jgi:hypothetical protein